MGTTKGLGELEALVLAAMVRVGDESNGRAVYDEILTRTGRDPSLAGVHVTLRRLETKGLARSALGSVSERGGRPRRYYRPTNDGLERLREFRRVWDRVWDGLPLSTGGDE